MTSEEWIITKSLLNGEAEDEPYEIVVHTTGASFYGEWSELRGCILQLRDERNEGCKTSFVPISQIVGVEGPFIDG